MTPMRTLAELLAWRAEASARDAAPDAIRFKHAHQPDDVVTGAQLRDRARAVAGALHERGVHAGDRVLLMVTAQREFVEAFFGCVWADAVPVPLVPPVFVTRLDDFVARFLAIAKTADARALLVSDEIAASARALGDSLADSLGSALPVLAPAEWRARDAPAQQIVPRRRPDDIALIQFTSGSTGAPKGVALTHANVLANVDAIGRATRFHRDDVGISWLPLYHDMGLIGGLLSTLRWGAPLVSLSPLEFAKRPVSWLRALSDHRGTLSPAPNFAFRRCLKLSDDDVAGIDLSAWRVAFNGAEPVDERTLAKFAQRFGAHGFRTSALYPVYGLAEHTLAVTFPRLGEEPRYDHVDRAVLARERLARTVDASTPGALTFVSVGVPLDGVRVEVRRDGRALLDGEVGGVFVKSASVMTGYFNDADATARSIVDGWLDTGDLGYLKDGALFITGREKDLIIRAGRNYYPHDLEAAAAEVAGVRAGRVVSFALDVDGEEHAIVVAEREVPPVDEAALAVKVADAVAARVGFRPERVVLVARGTLPITSSGKVQRRETRMRLVDGTL